MSALQILVFDRDHLQSEDMLDKHNEVLIQFPGYFGTVLASSVVGRSDMQWTRKL
jgi:hypothetical protein